MRHRELPQASGMVVGLGSFSSPCLQRFNPPDQTATHGDFEVVERVVDGDTLLLASSERVRLIGVDTPDSKRPKEARGTVRQGSNRLYPANGRGQTCAAGT